MDEPDKLSEIECRLAEISERIEMMETKLDIILSKVLQKEKVELPENGPKNFSQFNDVLNARNR